MNSLLLIYGDVELNPGPRKTCPVTISSCVTGISIVLLFTIFLKRSLIKAYNAQLNFDKMRISVTYLKSSFLWHDCIFNIPEL